MANGQQGFDWTSLIGPGVALAGSLATRPKTPAQTLAQMPPQFTALLNTMVQRQQQAQPLADSVQHLATAMMPSWVQPSTSASVAPSSPSTPAPIMGQLPTGDSQIGNIVHNAAGPVKAIGALSGIPIAGPLIAMGAGAVDLIHNAAGNQTNRAREEFAKQLTGSDDMNQFWSWLSSRVSPNAYRDLYNIGAGTVGKDDTTANQRWMQAVGQALQLGPSGAWTPLNPRDFNTAPTIMGVGKVKPDVWASIQDQKFGHG